MHTSSKLKRDFINKWVKCLQICCSSKKKTECFGEKEEDKALRRYCHGFFKNATTCWSNALISDAKKDDEYAILLDNLSGHKSPIMPQKTVCHMIASHKRVRSKKILKRSCSISQREKKTSPPKSKLATYIAKRLVKKRTEVLKRLVPGGETMDEFSLIKEALDYILSLRIQVEVMRSVANATELMNKSNSTRVD